MVYYYFTIITILEGQLMWHESALKLNDTILTVDVWLLVDVSHAT